MEIPLGNLLTAIVTAITTIVAVVVANKLTYSRSNKEKVWDLRRQAYGAILSELASVERLCGHADEYIQEDALRYFQSDHYNAYNTQIAEHMEAIRKRFSDDYLIISENFIAIFEEFLDELSANAPNDSPPDEHERFTAALRKSRPRLIAQARSEMTARKGWLPFST